MKKDYIQVLETDDHLYYVIFGEPEVIKEKAIKKAEHLKKGLELDGEVLKRLSKALREKHGDWYNNGCYALLKSIQSGKDFNN